MEQEIREYALDIGFDNIGFTTAEPFPQLTQALEERHSGYSWISDGLLQLSHIADPRFVLPTAQSLVVLIYDYYKQSYPPALLGKIGKAYQSRLYTGKKRIFGSRLRLLINFLESKGMEVGTRPAMPERQAAVRAGLGSFGRNTFLYVPDKGSYVAITTLAVSGELAAKVHEPLSECPKDCRCCIEACPTGALYEPFKMDPLRCIAFNSYGTGNFPGAPERIPREIREKMGTWIYGCDMCQDACPRNRKRLQMNLTPDAFLLEMAPKLDLTTLLLMDNRYYQETVQPILYGYMWEKKFLQRNAAIALGNSGDETAIGSLARAMEDSQEMVRAYAGWALGRIGGAKGKAVLENALKKETASEVTEEIKWALESCR
ncbi:MAG TPA: 4Fe-4S double cluster binding domain-containing protein [Candidatus Limnocylindrales bacterium]|nr:4Fe-4S double cluster binding domain-containing protein [Candidatus Limnocylindrales bacterium]